GPGTDEGAGYRTAGEVERWKARDPVVTMRKVIAGDMKAGDLDKLERDVDAEVHAAIAAAKRAAFPDFRNIMSGNWSGEYAPVIERFTSGATPIFQGGQTEARPGPF